MNTRSYQSEDRDAVVQLWQECGLVAPQNDPARDIARNSFDLTEYEPKDTDLWDKHYGEIAARY